MHKTNILTSTAAASPSKLAVYIILFARSMSPGSIARTASPIVGLSQYLPNYVAGPASCTFSAPAHALSVCALLGLACLRRSRRHIRHELFASLPVSAADAIHNSAAIRLGR